MRHVRPSRGPVRVTRIRAPQRLRKDADQDLLSAMADLAYLRKKNGIRGVGKKRTSVRIADLFSSCGFMSLGVSEACRALGKRFRSVLAVECNEAALNVYKKNFSPDKAEHMDIRKGLSGALGTKRKAKEKRFIRGVGKIDLLLGGPPCQGHSDLNNYTRRSDPKNGLYKRMARFAELVKPKHIIIENVPAVVHDSSKVVQTTLNRLKKLGYHVDSGLVEISRLGVPQKRRRHIVIASLTKKLRLAEVVSRYTRKSRTVGWVLEDLLGHQSESLFDTASTPNSVTERRIDYLFDHHLYNLPNRIRPECHRSGGHSYTSVYGRLRWNGPAQTITTGFNTMGQGRFVHPRRRRTLTPHEAARLQFIPDFFSFDGVVARTQFAEMIGNAVPPKLTYVFALELLR